MGLDSYLYKTKKEWLFGYRDVPEKIEVDYWRKNFNLTKYSHERQDDIDCNPLEIEVTPFLKALYNLDDNDRLYLIHSQ